MKRLTARQGEVLDYIRHFVGDNAYPPTIREIAAHFGISVKGAYDHMKALQKKGYLEASGGRSRGIRIIKREDAEPAEVREIPILGTVAAGRPLFSDENFEGSLSVPGTMVGRSGRYFALHVRGESMKNAGILDGDTAVIRHQETAENGEIVVAMVDNAVTLKRLYRESNRFKLKAENEAFPPIYTQDARVIGKLACIVRSYL